MAFSARNQKAISALALQLDDIRAKLEAIHEAESERFDAMSETMQESDDGDAHQQALAAVEETVGTLEEISENLSDLNTG